MKDQIRNWLGERLCYVFGKPGHSFINCRFGTNPAQKAAGLQTSWKPRYGRQKQKSKTEEGDENSKSSVVEKKTCETTSTSTESEGTQVKEGCDENAC